MGIAYATKSLIIIEVFTCDYLPVMGIAHSTNRCTDLVRSAKKDCRYLFDYSFANL